MNVSISPLVDLLKDLLDLDIKKYLLNKCHPVITAFVCGLAGLPNIIHKTKHRNYSSAVVSAHIHVAYTQMLTSVI